MTNKVRDLVCSAIMLVFGIGMLVVAFTIPHKIASDVGSGYVPKFVAICIIVAAVAALVVTLLDKSAAAAAKYKFFDDMKGGLGTLALMVAYMSLLQPIGFIVSSAAYLFAQILLLSDETNRKPILFAIISVLFPIAIDALFVFVIKMPLPKGIIGF